MHELNTIDRITSLISKAESEIELDIVKEEILSENFSIHTTKLLMDSISRKKRKIIETGK